MNHMITSVTSCVVMQKHMGI